MEHTSSVRRPESGTWQSVAMETAAMGGPRNLPAPYVKKWNTPAVCEET
ncbi:unnamed protein product [Staurois parvus]|uniref:Uncharacterized protein n=1 Tax=Staurois parvus TaxID=386267 RepID=A0ABN9FVV8_9NEOB|nr:unnamed protein product [Staurois parvus]